MLVVCKYFIANVFGQNIYNVVYIFGYTCLCPGYYCAINNTRRIKALRQMAGKNKGLRLGRAETQYHDIPLDVFSDSHI